MSNINVCPHCSLLYTRQPLSCTNAVGTIGQSYRIQFSPTLAEGTWVGGESFTCSGPKGLMEVSATGDERRFYRAVSP